MPTVVIIAVALVAVVAATAIMYHLIRWRFLAAFERWKNEHDTRISREAIKGSQAAITGRVLEKFTPYLPEFGFNPRDVRFLGDPVDFVIFDGLSEGEVKRVVFMEVKTGGGTLNSSERRVKGAVAERRVEWRLFRLPGGAGAEDGE